MPQPRVFVSYSRKDVAFTRRVVEDFHYAGAEVWVDVAGIVHGNFMQAIDEAIERCDWMTLILTPNAIQSQYVRDEVYTALHRVKQGLMRDVIPILAASCPTGSIPPQWDARQRYDATQDYAEAIAGVLHAMGLPLIPAGDAVPAAPVLISTPGAPAPSTTPLPETLEDLLTRGKLLTARNEWGQAVTRFQQAVKLDQTSFDAWAHLAIALNESGHHAEALVACNRALALDGQKGWVWNRKGLILGDLKRYLEAIDAYDRALALVSGDAPMLNNKAHMLRLAGRDEEALTTYDQALEADPNYAFAWNGKGYVLHTLRRDEEAVYAYDCAISR